MYYWDGAFWKPIATGGTGGGVPGPQGPPGRDGESVNVFVQTTAPTPQRPGDFWINDAAARSYISADQMVAYPTFDTKTYPTLDDVKGQ
jgi:hypothetical protein